MKNKDIVVGEKYFTYVSGAKVLVQVMARVVKYNGRTAFAVFRVDANGRPGKVLPKARSAAALHPTQRGYWPSMTDKQDAPTVTTEQENAALLDTYSEGAPFPYGPLDPLKHPRSE